MRIQPPRYFASEFYDLDPQDLDLPPGDAGLKLAAWWKSASPVEQRDLLHKSRGRGLSLDLLTQDDDDDDDDVEYDDDDDDILRAEQFCCDPEEYEEDYA